MALASRSAFEPNEKPFKPNNAASQLKFISVWKALKKFV